jgi:long-subunit fatty acid transport protein
MGEQRTPVNALLRGMGSISSAYANPYAVNTDNPASYASLKLTTYEAGGEARIRTVTTATDEKYKTGTSTLSHLTIGIPINKHLGMSFGLRPETNVFYDLADTSVRPGFGNAVAKYSGSGTVNYGFIGFGGKVKGFSLGFNFGYLFGTINNNMYLLKVDDTAKVHDAYFINSTKIGGIYWKTGAMYETKLNNKLGLRVGGTFTLNQDINARRDNYSMTVYTYVDTSGSNQNVQSKFTLPMTYNLGAQLLGTDRWTVGVDYTAANWSQFRNFGQVDSVQDNTMKIAVGGEYTPDPSAIRKYLQRVTYRLGFYYGTDYVRLRNVDMNYYAVTGGLSLPFRRTTDRLHLALEVGQRGTTTNGLLKENFVRFALGISLNDKWFIKRKYE